ncbi:hypothetical protein [Terribacillus sp. DMT04]|uniref:hypothetical protein n=1 Tax=Terribacillus sp. DMT04 TaxID=2850441 RepID=UPI001C2BE4A6|nr:hypothetical protein [Terribacillus sp. DMT04]QXE02281.1 hypothetical protein KS242_03350 [Terribacillus sp. DMT04]
MVFLVDAFNLIASYTYAYNVSEDDIQENMEQLRKTDWFQQYLKSEPYRQLLITDKGVRVRIGKLNNKRLAKNPHKESYQHIVTKALQKKIIVSDA